MEIQQVQMKNNEISNKMNLNRIQVGEGDQPIQDINELQYYDRLSMIQEEGISNVELIDKTQSPKKQYFDECTHSTNTQQNNNHINNNNNQKLDLTFNQFVDNKESFLEHKESSLILQQQQMNSQKQLLQQPSEQQNMYFQNWLRLDDSVGNHDNKNGLCEIKNNNILQPKNNLNLQLTDTFSRQFTQTLKSNENYLGNGLSPQDTRFNQFTNNQMLTQTSMIGKSQQSQGWNSLQQSKRGSKENIAQIRYKDYIQPIHTNPDISDKKYQEIRQKQFLEICHSYQTLQTNESQFKSINHHDDHHHKSYTNLKINANNNNNNNNNITSEETKAAQQLLKQTLFSSSSVSKLSRNAFSPPKIALDQQYLELLRRPSSQSTYSQNNNCSNNNQSQKKNSNNVSNNNTNNNTSQLNNSEKNNQQQSMNTSSIGCNSSRIDRLAYEHQIFDKNKKQKQIEQYELEKQICTFQPNTRCNTSRSKSRNPQSNNTNLIQSQSLYQSQSQLLNQNQPQSNVNNNNNNSNILKPKEQIQEFVKKQELLQKLHDFQLNHMVDQSTQQINSTIKSKPTLNKKTQKLAEEINKENINVVDRLYQSTTFDKSQQQQQLNLQQSQSSKYYNNNTQRKSHQNNLMNQELLQHTFIPSITERAHNIMRNKPIDTLLYDDAQRRQKEQHELINSNNNINRNKQSSSQHNNYNSNNSNQSNLINNNQQLFINGFIKEFNTALNNHNNNKMISQDNNQLISSQSKENQYTLIFIEMISLLKSLRFIPQSTYDTNKSYSQICSNIWHQLRGDQKGYIIKRNLQIFLLGIMNVIDNKNQINKIQNNINISNVLSNHLINQSKLNEIKIFDNYQSQSSLYNSNIDSNDINHINKSIISLNKDNQNKQQQLSDLFFDEYDNLILNKDDVQKIHQKYQCLYINRLSSEQSYSNQINNNNNHNHNISKDIEDKRSKSPQPQPQQQQLGLSVMSQRLAQYKREKLMYEVLQKEPQRTTIDLFSILNHQKEKTKIEIEEIRQKNIQLELSQCTFKPQTRPTSPFEKKMSVKQINNNNDKEMKLTENKIQQQQQSQQQQDRFEYLHSLGKNRLNKRERNQNEIEYERDCDQCTFFPQTNQSKINYTSNQLNNNQYLTNSKLNQSIEKNIQRLHSARLKHYVKDQLCKSGSTVSKKRLQKIEETAQKQVKQGQLKTQTKTIQQQQQQQVLKVSIENELLSFTSLFSSKQKSMPTLLPTNESKQDLNCNNYELQSQQNRRMNDYSQLQSSQDSLNTLGLGSQSIKQIEEERVPQLFVDVNIEEGKSARIVVYEGDKSEDLSKEFARQFNLDENMCMKLKDMLDLQIKSLLTKIEEVSANEDEDDDQHQSIYMNRSAQKSKTKIL